MRRSSVDGGCCASGSHERGTNHHSNGLEFAVSATSSNPHEYARRGGDAKHPVIARLPDVSSLTSTSHSGNRESQSEEYVDYRFDAPAGTIENAAAAMRRITQRPALQRTPQERRTSARRVSPSILPESDPFSIPSSSLYERFAPVAQFLMMFAFFTAAGTAFLMMRGGTTSGGENKMQPVTPPPVQAPVSQKLVPAPEKLETAEKNSATSSGPIGAKDDNAIEQMFVRLSKQENPAESISTPLKGADKLQTEDEVLAAEKLQPVDKVQIADKPALPKVQTSEPYIVGGVGYESSRPDGSGIPARAGALAPAPGQVVRRSSAPPIARLPGFIFESPTRQAQHDNHQPGLH
jgi:hypothetical protein